MGCEMIHKTLNHRKSCLLIGNQTLGDHQFKIHATLSYATYQSFNGQNKTFFSIVHQQV